MKKEKSCGCIVIDNDKVLLVKHNKGHISFPKGHIEIGETEEECAIRETMEETGLTVKIISKHRYLQTYIVKDNILKEVVYFLAIKESGTLKRQEQEIDSLGFYSYNEALSLISYEDTVNIFKKVIEDIKNLNLHLK